MNPRARAGLGAHHLAPPSAPASNLAAHSPQCRGLAPLRCRNTLIRRGIAPHRDQLLILLICHQPYGPDFEFTAELPSRRICTPGPGSRSYLLVHETGSSSDLCRGDDHETGRWLSNRAVNSHLPFRRREREMSRFRSMRSLEKFLSVHVSVHPHFPTERHLQNQEHYKQARAASLPAWRGLLAA